MEWIIVGQKQNFIFSLSTLVTSTSASRPQIEVSFENRSMDQFVHSHKRKILFFAIKNYILSSLFSLKCRINILFIKLQLLSGIEIKLIRKFTFEKVIDFVSIAKNLVQFVQCELLPHWNCAKTKLSQLARIT